MIVSIKVNGVNEIEELTLEEEKRKLLVVSNLMLSKVMENERENVMLMLMGGFKRLRYEDLEEIYSDGCLMLWKKMMDEDFELLENGMVGYLKKVCWNIGRHYLRKVNDDVESLDLMMERNGEFVEDECSISDLFDVVDEKSWNDDKRYEKLEEIWKKLSVIDRMILESYYVDGCKMEEIAKRVGYKNGNSVKSKKNKVLKKILEMKKKEGADFKDLPQVA